MKAIVEFNLLIINSSYPVSFEQSNIRWLWRLPCTKCAFPILTLYQVHHLKHRIDEHWENK